MKPILLFQDPTNGDAPRVLDALLDACEGATSGGGVFAFASRPGIELLLEDKRFAKFLHGAAFDLIVGIDAITNVGALKLLGEYAEKFSKLSVRAFLNPTGDLFHPKFCWFRTSTGGRAVIGSGNLTPGGLFDNFEAFTVRQLSPADANTLVEQWNEWTARHAEALRTVDDLDVLARAEKNMSTVIPVKNADAPPVAPPTSATQGEVLVAEISKNRPGQADFGEDIFRNFFHMSAHKTTRLLLAEVDPQGVVGPVKPRQGVAVKSHNYRIELEGTGKRPYPKGGPPIGVFRRVAPRKFLYRVLIPSEPGYEPLDAILTKHWPKPPKQKGKKMRRVVISPQELAKEWPGTPL